MNERKSVNEQNEREQGKREERGTTVTTSLLGKRHGGIPYTPLHPP